ncbi:ferredoxin [Lactococcus nasutitermitis]|uniref:Ferredoxin n=1 Tax=Lactococcus nasutitermitis TaxID=1652957 RepID=A0ABV9JF98_9LACT|nr:ferredoxin [Lactococcus nasutitermitis]
MKIKIIPEKCIACGLCHLEAADVFDYSDDGIVKFYNSNQLEKSFPETSSLISAVKKCPSSALQIVDDKNFNSR